MSALQLDGDLLDLSVDEIQPNAWNPNEMDEESFNRLADEIESVGFINPIQVVPTDGKYVILGGEHRWRAAKSLGFETVPAIVLRGKKWQEKDLQKFVTTRLNAISGKLNPQKFMSLYQDLAGRHEHEALQSLMGFTDRDLFDKMSKKARGGLADAGVSKRLLEKFDDASKEISTVEDLSMIINKIFTEHGSELQSSFMWFGYGGSEHLYVQIDKSTHRKLKSLTERILDDGGDLGDVFKRLIDAEVQSIAR